MKITIDLSELDKLKITANQYCFLYSLFFRTDSCLLTDQELEHLQDQSYIKITEEEVVLRDKGRQLFEATTSDSLFFEFFSSYPIKVPNGSGGYRVLRTKDTDSKEAIEIKKKYLTIAKKPGEHEKIINGLKVYVKNQFPYIVGIDVFLNKRIWEKYCDLEVKEVIKGTENKTQI